MASEITSALSLPHLQYHNPCEAPFSLHGILPPDETLPCYHRLPPNVAKSTSEGVEILYVNTAGGRVRFATDSPYISLKVSEPSSFRMSHMAQTGVAGFSLYARSAEDSREKHIGTFNPMEQKEFENVIHFPERKMREITIYMPLYNGVDRFYIGVDSTAKL